MLELEISVADIKVLLQEYKPVELTYELLKSFSEAKRKKNKNNQRIFDKRIGESSRYRHQTNPSKWTSRVVRKVEPWNENKRQPRKSFDEPEYIENDYETFG